MNIIYSKTFKEKASTIGYPILGFDYYVLTIGDNSKYSDYMDGVFGSIEGVSTKDYIKNLMDAAKAKDGSISYSITRRTYSLIENGSCSIAIRPIDVEEDPFDLIVLLYVDLCKYPNGEVDTDQYMFSIDNIAAIIDAGQQDTTPMVTQVINSLKLPDIDFKCSFKSTMNDESTYDQVQHYTTALFNRKIYRSANDNEFIEPVSGDYQARVKSACEDPRYLNGHMTIDASGVTRL